MKQRRGGPAAAARGGWAGGHHASAGPQRGILLPWGLPTAQPRIAHHSTRRKNKEALYKFSKVFPEDTAQQAIYSGVAEGMVTDLLSAQQKEAVIMAYGVTSAGKTFTMQVRCLGGRFARSSGASMRGPPAAKLECSACACAACYQHLVATGKHLPGAKDVQLNLDPAFLACRGRPTSRA